MNISLVIPAHNESERIIPTLESYSKFFPKIADEFELIVVVNNSTDNTLLKVLEFKKNNHFIKVIDISKKVGKGGALIAGLKAAKYNILGFLDADDAFKLEDLRIILNNINNGIVDVGIASKWKGQSFFEVDEPFMRKLMSRVWNRMVKLFLGLKFLDTQAGAKFFSKTSWDSISKNFIGKGFEFDIDILDRFDKGGFLIKEYFVHNKFKEMSKFGSKYIFPMFINFWRIVFRSKPQHPAYYYRAYRDFWRLTHIFYKNKIDKLVSFVPKGSTFLDCGCGSGALLKVANVKRNTKVTGIDIRKDQCLFAKRLCPTGDFIPADIRKFNLGKKFDAVNCSDVVEHFFPKEREIIFANLDRHVKNNGTLVIAFPSWFYIVIFERMWRIIRRIMSPTISFDDDVHLVVGQKSVIDYYTKKGYNLIGKGKAGLGLIDYVALQK